jgi:adenosylhomocysteinase
MGSDIQKDIVDEGGKQFQWAKRNMPALALARNYLMEHGGKAVLNGIKLGVCLHISKETSVLIDAFRSFGMEIDLVAANPLSTKDSIAGYLSSIGVNVRGRGYESEEEYHSAIESLASSLPEMIIDDGGELHVAYSLTNSRSCFGGTDETTSGTDRLRSLDRERKLRYPVIPVNEARTKHLFDNKYGTGQSSLDGLVRATGLLLAGKVVAVSGYGWVGRGVAERARGMGARVIITEVDPVSALEAHLDGFEVGRMNDVVGRAQIFLTCTGQTDVLSRQHFKRMRSGAILGNCGHFDKEINVNDLVAMSRSQPKVGKNITEYRISGKSIFLLCEGRVINLVAADGHPPEVMQLSFANQLLSIHYLALHNKELRRHPTKVLPFPRKIDELVAKFALSSFSLKIDRLSAKQRKYAQSFTR